MASETNVKAIMRKPKNVPTTSSAEKVLEEYDTGQGVLVRRACIVQTVSLAAAASASLTVQLPAGAKVVFADIYLTTAMVLVTATKLGVGVAGTLAAFFLSNTTMTIGAAQPPQSPPDTTARVVAASTILLSTVDNSGVAAGSGTGTVKVLVVYEYLQPIVA